MEMHPSHCHQASAFHHVVMTCEDLTCGHCWFLAPSIYVQASITLLEWNGQASKRSPGAGLAHTYHRICFQACLRDW